MVEQEQIQKRTFTNWVNAQLAKRRPPCQVADLFNDFRDGSKLLDLLEVMSNQCIRRERGRGTFQDRSNIEKGLAFLRQKSIKLVNINIPDIIDGKPSIVLGLIWTIILQYHIEELASGLSFSSRQSSMESLASLDSWSSWSSRTGGGSLVPRRGSPLHARFRLSAKKALMLWVREQCHKAGCSVNVKDFKGSWRSGVVFLAILYALRCNLVDLSEAARRSNKQNLDEAFRVAERELNIPRLLEPDDVDVREPDEKSIMTYVAQFLQYSKDAPVSEDDAMQTQYLSLPKAASPVNLPVHYTPAISASPLRQGSPDRKAQEVSCWLLQAYEELLEGWDSTQGESYSERYHVFQTFVVSFNEQRRPIVPLLTAMRRSPTLSEEQRALREAWDALTEKLREYKLELDVSLPAPLDSVAHWLLRTEGVLSEEEGDPQDHSWAADQAKEKQEQLKVCIEEMPQQVKTFQAFQNQDEDGNMLVPTEKMEDLKRRFTSVRVSAKYHGIKLEYREHRHTVLDLLSQIRTKVNLWKSPYLSPEAVRVLLHEWHEVVTNQELPSMLEAALHKLKQVSEKYSSKSALAADYHHICQQVMQLEEDTVAILVEVNSAKNTLGRVLTTWDSYSDGLSAMQAWLEDVSAGRGYDSQTMATSESVAEWGSRQAHLNQVANFLMESTDPQTSRSLEEELLKLNVDFDEFVQRNAFDCETESNADIQTRPRNLQALIREAKLLLQEPVETMSGPLRTYRKRIQLVLRKIKEVDLEAHDSSPEFPVDQLQKLKMAMSDIKKTMCEAEQVCVELQHSISGLDSRLAELLHWETEAMETYQLLRATQRQQQRGQDPRARVLISRGLQLEGQVVTEEQDLQVLIMTNQKSSPIQYIQTATMQDRVRAALSKSQEAVGMLSSMGARRDISRSPTGGPPSKVFLQAKSKPHHQRQSDTMLSTREFSSSLMEFHPSQETFVPKIVVQEYREEKKSLPPCSSAQEMTQAEGQTQVWKGMSEQQQTVEDTLIPQLLSRGTAQQETKCHQPQVEAKGEGERNQRQKEVHQEGEHQLAEMKEYKGGQYGLTHVEFETKLQHKSETHELILSVKKPLSPQELQCKKAQALKNRPWLHKMAKQNIQSLNKNSVQEPVQAQTDKDVVGFIQEVPHPTETSRKQSKDQDKSDRKATQQKEQPQQIQNQQKQKGKEQPFVATQHKENLNKSNTKDLSLEQSEPPVHILVQSQVQLQPSPDGQVVAEGPTWAQVRPLSPMQDTIRPSVPSHIQLGSHPQSWAPVRPSSSKSPAQLAQSQAKPETLVKVQPNAQPRPQAENQAQTILQHQTHIHPQTQTQILAHAMTQHHGSNPGSMIQAQTQSQVQTQPQKYAQQMAQSQAKAEPLTNVQNHPLSKAQSRKYTHSVTQSHTKTETMALIQTPTQPKMEYLMHTQPASSSQAHGQPTSRTFAQPKLQPSPTQHLTQGQPVLQPRGHPVTQYYTQSQPAVQDQGHAAPGQLHPWTQVSSASSMSTQNQASVQPQCHPQPQPLSQQWAPVQEPQNKDFIQQRHHIPPAFPQPICQAHSQIPQWAQGSHPQRPQMDDSGPSNMAQLYNQPQMQLHSHTQVQAHTLSQMGPQSQQQPQIQPYDVALMQTQGHAQQQMWMQVPHHVQTHPYLQSQQCPPVEHQLQTQHQLRLNILAHIPQQLNQTNLQYPTQSQLQPYLRLQSQPHIQTQVNVQPHIQLSQFKPQPHQPPPQFRPLAQAPNQPQAPSLPPYIPQPPPPKMLSSTQSQTQSLLQYKPEPQVAKQLTIKPSTQMKTQSLPQNKLEPQRASQPKFQSPNQAKALTLPHYMPEQVTAQPKVQPSPQPKTLFLPQYKPELQLTPQPKVPPPTQGSAISVSKPSIEPQLPQLNNQQPVKPATSSPSRLQPQVETPPEFESQSPPQANFQVNLLPQLQPQSQAPPQFNEKQPQTLLKSSVCVLPQSQAGSPDLCMPPPALAQAPPQAYSEAYAKAQALARNGFEEAKHCLQEHIREAISDKCLPAEQAFLTNSLRTLDPDLLEEFLRAAKGMEAFCTPSQLRDMDFFTQSVRSQWEACFSSEGQVAQAGHQAVALQELCDMLSPEDAHRLAHTQLRECESSLAAIQRQFSGDQEAPLLDSRIPVVFDVERTIPIETAPSGKPQIPSEVSQMKLKTANSEQEEVENRSSVEEVNKKEALEKYENYKKSLQVQLSKNEQSIRDVPSDSVTLKGLHTRLQEIQFLRQDTESLWSEFINQCSQLSGNAGVDQEKSDLQDQWQAQQSNLQRRGSLLSAALRQIDSTENHMVDFTDRLDRYLRQPKAITAFTLANTNILKDIKELDENIQSELDQLARLEQESSNLDPRDCLPLSREVEAHRSSVDQLRQQVRKSEAAARALDRFLMSLRTVEEDIAGVQGAPCSEAVVLQDCRAKLALIRQSVDSLKDKAPELDLLLQGARLTVTRNGSPASCLDMVSVLLNKLEEADSGLVGQQQSLKRETHSKSLGLRKRTLFGELSKLQNAIESRGLTEATMPAVQHRFRALSDLEDQVQTQNSEIQSLRELPECQGQGRNLLEELETEYNKTLTSLTDRKQQCSILIELLKKFQSCRSHLNSTVQRAEQTIGEQASYMGKDNLHKIITKVQDIKKELSGLSEQMDEMRGVCRQLQSQLKKFPDCREAPFEAEADTLMDTWLDITEKIDTYMDNLQVGLELWDKQLMLGGEIDSWAACKLALFAESHPFHNRQQVLAMKDEIQAYEENIEHFHKKSEEIQEMLQSHEAPLELQVMETQLRKRMEQVKELFADCADIFEELMVVKKHLAEKIEECLSAVENIQFSVNEVQTSEPRLETQLKDLCDDLEVQEEQAELALSEIALVSSVASSQVLEELSVDCGRLTDAITRIKDMIHLKREEKDKGLLKVIQDERQSFEDWFQDLQLAVNECFENPESRADIETSLQRLTGFLKASDAERRLEQLRDHLERGKAQIDTQQLSELSDWLKEQHEEVHTFKTHCLNRQKQMESLHCDLSSLQTQHDSFHEWLQGKEKLSAVPGTAKHLLQDLQHESQRVDILMELLASVRHQGVRADRILKDSDNVIQRYRNLQARLQTQAEEHDVSGGQLDQFATQAEHIRTWFKDLLCSVTSACEDLSYKEMSLKAEAVLSAKPEGDTQMNRLRLQSQSLCGQDQLEQSRKQEVQQSVRNLEDEWRIILQAAEDALNKAEMQARLNQEVEALKAQSENLQSWINNLTQNLQSYESLQDVLLSKPDMQSKLQHLKERGQSLCKNLDLDEGLRHEIRDVMRGAEEQWRYTMKAAEEAKTEASAEREVAALRSNIETTRSWIREQRCKLLSVGTHMPLQERLQVIQAVFSCRDEGESKVLDLKREAEHLWKTLDDSRKPELALLVEDTEQQWKSVLQTCKEAELRSLAEDFEAQSKNTKSWVRERELQLQSVGIHSPPEDRRRMAQDVLQSKSNGDCQVNNLRRRGQTLFDRQDVEEDRKCEVQQAVQDAEEQWRKVLRVARQLEEDAGSQMNQEMEARDSELREFQTVQQETSHWLSGLQHQLDSLSSQTTVQDRLHATQTIVSAKSDGDCKLQELKRRFQSLCAQELEQPQKLELQKIVQDTEDQWTRTHQGAKAALDAEEKQMALERQLKEHEEAREQVQAWLEDKRQNLISLHCYKDSEVTIKTAQAILSSKPEGDCKMAELQKQNKNLCDRDDVKAATLRESGQAVKALDELWRSLLRDAENSLNKAEVVYSLSRQLQAFFSQAASTETWLEELQTQLENIGMDIRGSQAQIENRLNTTHMILSSKSCGESRVMDLQRRKQSLCEHKDLEEDSSLKVRTKVKKVEEQWRTVLQVAESRSRQLQSVQDHLVSCRYQRGQAEALLAELQMQTSDLPRIFPWPGLGERRTVTEQAHTLLDRGSAMGPLLSNLRTQAAKLYETTQDPDWADSTCGGMEDSIPVLLRELTEAVTSLEHGIMVERQFTQLVEQHEAAQDWLREQVKGLQGPPDDRPGLHSAINTLKALLQTVQREQREMKELDTARDDLVGLCTSGGRDALILEVSHLYELCAISEQDVRERLMACEARLQELYHQAAHRTKELKERSATLQWELSSLDQALGYAQPQSGIHQLRQHWNSVQNCEKSLEELRVKIDELNQEVAADSELPTEISTTVDSLRQQQDSLESRLREHQQNCSTNTAHCLSQSLQALQDWNHSKPSKSITSLQETADEGEKLQALLREVFYHQQFLSDCLNQDVFDQLSKEGADTLREAGTLQMSLCQILKELTEKNEQKTECQHIDDVDIQIEEMKTSLVAPPWKNKHSPEKKSTVKIQPNIPSTETSTLDQDDLSITSRSGEQTEVPLLKEIKVIPKMRKSETQEGSTLLTLTYETVCMETKEVKCETLDEGQEEVIEQSQVIPARGKPTFAETPRVEEDIEHQISLSSNDQNTTIADDSDFVAMRSKATVPSYLTITSLTAPDLRLDHNDEPIVEKKESHLDDTESAEVAQFVTGIIESAIRDVDLLSKKDPLELERRQIFSASQVATEMSEGVIVEEGKISPHPRKFKSVKFSPQLSKKEEPIMTKEESDLDPFMRKTHDDKEHSVCEEAQKASGSVEFPAIAEFVTGIIESAMRDVDLLAQKDQLELEKGKTSSVSQVATKIPEVVEEGKILPPTSESKSVKYSPQLPKKEETTVPKEESNLEPVEEKTQDENEYRIGEEARRDSASVEGSVVAEFGTGFIESAIRDVDSRSQKDPPEVESVKTSSAPQVVTGIPKVVILVEGKLSPPTRKSKSLTPTPQMPKKEKAGVTKEESNLEPRKEKHHDDKEHEHVCEDLSFQKARKDSGSVDDSAVARFITGLIESAVRDVDLRSQKDLLELESRKKSSAPQDSPKVVIVAEGEITPPKRKSKSMKLHCEEVTVSKQTSSYSRDQTETTTPQPPKRKSKSSTASPGILKKGPKKTKELDRPSSHVGFAKTTVEEGKVVAATAERVKISPETQKLPTRRKSKDHDVPSVPTDTDIAISEGFGPESGVKPTTEHIVKTTPDAAVFGDRKLSPPKRKSKLLKVSAEPKKREDQTITKEEPNILKFKEAKHDETISEPVEESTSEMLENVMESDVNKLAVLAEDQPPKSQTVTEMSFAEQTMIPMPTVIELELLETTRERPEEAKDHKVLLKVGVEDANTDLENTSLVLDRIPGSADVNTLELNVQDENPSAVSNTEQRDMVQGQTSVVLATLQPNVTELIEIVLCEKAVEKTCQTEALEEVLELNQEGLTETEEHEASKSTDAFQDTPMTIHMGPDVHLLQVEIRACQEEQKNKLETGKKEKSTTDKSQVEKQEMSTERHKNGAQSDACKPVSPAFDPDQPSGTKKDEVESNQDNKPPQLIQTALERPKEDIHQVQLSIHDRHISPASFLEQEEIQMTVIHGKEPRQESSVKIEITSLNKGDIQPINSSIRVTQEAPECLTETLSHPDVETLSKAQTEDQKTNATKEEADNLINSTSVQKGSGKVVRSEPQDVPHTGTTTTTFEKNEASVEQSELAIDTPERSLLTDVFSRTKAIIDMELLNEEAFEDCLAEQMTSPSSDLDGLLCRLVSNLLSCKNHSAELQPAAMSQQVKEAEKCRAMAQDQASLLCQQREAEADRSEALKYMEDQWSAAAQDAIAVIQNKVDQLQVVQEFCHQTHKAKATLERLAAQLDVLRLSQAESSQEESNRLNSMKRTLEEKRTVLGELLGIHTKLYPLLSRAHQAAAKSMLQTRHQEWRELERAVDKALHHADVQSHSCSSLLLELSHLRGHLESISEEPEAEHPEVSLWDCKKAKQLMMAHAEVKGAHVKYLHLKEMSEALPASLWPKETVEIKKALLNVKDQLCLTEEWMSSQIQKSSNPVIKKVMTLGRDGLSWAKKIESEIEGRCNRVCLLPEAVYHQLRAIKKLQSEVTVKRRQLNSQVKAATELLPQLDQIEEMPVMHSLLEYLEERSKSITEKLSKAVKDIESGLQVREKLSEQIANIDSWVGTHLQRETMKTIRMEFMSPGEVDRSDLEIQETLVEAEKQSAACEALLMKSKDIASELSITENCQLFDKLINLQEDISNISSHERVNKKELDEHVRAIESNKRELITVERSLRQMQEDLNKLRFPVTTELLQILESFKQMLLEHKSKIDLLQSWIQEDKTSELYSVTAEIHNKLTTLQLKARDHEKYLNMRQTVEDLKEAVEEQLSQTKEDSQVEEKYKIYQKLLFHFPLIKRLCKEVGSKLHMISTDLYPSQLCSEQQRLQQNEERFKTLEMKTLSNLSIIEWSLFKELDLDSERKVMRAFLWDAHQELQNPPPMTPNETCINKEYQRILFLKKMVESRMRVLEVLEHNKGNTEGTGSSDLEDLKNVFLRECDSQMDNIADARTSLRNYTHTVKQALQFLRDFEVSLLPLPALTGVCCEKLEETQVILASLEDHFQPYMDQLSQVALHPLLSPVELERLQESILSQFLVRMSTLKANGYLQLENLSSCAENYRKYTKFHDKISLSMRKAEASLEQFTSQKVNSLADCSEQLEKLKVLQEDLDSVQDHLEEMVEWCPEQRCRGHRETSMAADWRRVTKLRLCSQQLTARLKQRIVEWSDITRSVEKASAVLQQVKEELPQPAPLMASTKELLDLQQRWEQYQDRLDCEHRALSILELRVARLLGVPANMEQAPPTPFCLQLQAMQTIYDTLKQRSREGLEWIKLELEEKEKVQEELQVVWVWLTAADSLLSDIDPSSSPAKLKGIHSQLCIQKALVHRIKERLKSKYFESDMVPVEINGQLQEIQKTLEQVEDKVEEAIEKSGPVHRIAAKLLETQAGLRSVQERLEDRSSSVAEAKLAQKMVWDKLDKWHSCVAALESDVQGLESPQEALYLTERLVEVQQLHVQLVKQAEQKTTLLSRMQTWLEEHQEMINSSKSWMSDSQSWLAAPRTYTTAKCLSEHVGALQTVLNDSEQIRTTLQDFTSVLDQISQAVEVSTLREQLADADLQVAAVQETFAAPLSRLEHAAAEVNMMETEVRKMQNNIAEIKTIFCSPETFPSPKEKRLKMVEQKIQSMRSSIADIQKSKLDLHLPEKAEETLTVFSVINQLQTLLLELEKKVPALFIQHLPTQTQHTQQVQGRAQLVTSQPELEESSSEEPEVGDAEPGRIRIAHVEDNVLQRSGDSPMTAKRATPEQRRSEMADSGPRGRDGGGGDGDDDSGGGGGEVLPAEEACQKMGGEAPELKDVSSVSVPERSQASRGQSQQGSGAPDDSSSEARSSTLDSVRCQNFPDRMVNTSTSTVSKAQPRSQQRCLLC